MTPKSLLPVLALMLLVSGCASRRPPPQLWDAASLADSSAPVIVFMNKPGGKVKTGVHPADVRAMIRVKEQVENAAGPLRVRLLVEDSPEPNGFSFVLHGQPMIAVNAGMINLLGQDADAMAALIGHELAHLYLEHGNLRRDREDKRMISSIALSFTLGMIGIPAPMDLTNVATTAVANSFSRDEEREADRYGVSYMRGAGYDPWGAVRLQEKLGKSSGGGTMLPFLSTHPANSERIENMKRLVMEGATGKTAAPGEEQEGAVP